MHDDPARAAPAVRRAEPFGRDSALLSSEGHTLSRFGKNIIRWLGKGFTRPEYVFLFELAGEPVGGVAFNAFEAAELEVMDFALDGGCFADGPALLFESVGLARSPEMKSVSYNLYDDAPDTAAVLGVFKSANFIEHQKKISFAFTGKTLPDVPGALRYRTLADVGEQSFVEAVRRVTVDSLDSAMLRDAETQGGVPAAQAYVDGLKAIDHRPDWWRLAVDEGGALLGLIIPQRLGETIGAINYVGVPPERRGKGYGLILLRDGTQTLLDAGLAKIIADIDVANAPMEKALRTLGYEPSANETVLKLVFAAD